jgi:hypothetical protein
MHLKKWLGSFSINSVSPNGLIKYYFNFTKGV